MADKPNLRLVLSDRTPGRSFDLYQSDRFTECFADGIGRVMAGPANIKLEFYRVNPSDEKTPEGVPIEEREMFVRVVIPSAAFLEAVANVVASLGSHIEQFDLASTNTKKAIQDAFDRVRNLKL
jgi:hypothetical protein